MPAGRTAPLAGLDSDLGWMLAAALHGYVVAAGAAVEGIPGGLRGYHVLAAAAAASCGNQLELARQLGADRTVMTHLIDALEAAGLVRRRPDPADRRARQVILTDGGRRTWAEAGARLSAVQEQVLAPLAPGERELVLDALRRLAAHAMQHGADPRANVACEAPATPAALPRG